VVDRGASLSSRRAPLNVAVTEERNELDVEVALDAATCVAQRPADAAGEQMATLDAEADEDPEDGA